MGLCTSWVFFWIGLSWVSGRALAPNLSAQAPVLMLGLLISGSGPGSVWGLGPALISGAWASAILCLGAQSRPNSASHAIGWGSLVALGGGLGLFTARTQLDTILAFEVMLLGALALLRATAKGERASEALLELLFWALLGSSLLILSLAAPSGSSPNPLQVLGLLGFCVKIPTWPFTSWLLRAHVEASTDFSVFLSGLLVKFGIVGALRFVGQGGLDWAPRALCALAVVGVLEACSRLAAQVDLKRVVALTTVVESNWMAFCLAAGSPTSSEVGLWLVAMHCLTTTSEFYLVEAIYRRWGSRSMLGVSGLVYSTPNLGRLALPSTLITVGAPASSLFAAKFVFFGSLAPTSPVALVGWGLVLLLYLPVLFMRVWVPVWFGQPSNNRAADVSSTEALVLAAPIALGLALGLAPEALLA